MDHHASRRELLLTSLMAALPLGISGAAASPLNPDETIIKPPDALAVANACRPFPPGSVDTVRARPGETTAPGLYYTLVRWHPGIYERAAPLFDRPLLHGAVGNLVGATAGRLRPRRVRAGSPPAASCGASRGTPHYDGVIRGHNEPVVIAICGIGPVNFTSSDPSKPPWREV